MRQFFRGAALALALALTMTLLLGGCAGSAPNKGDPAPEAPSQPEPAPAPSKTLYERGAELAAELAEMAGNRDYLSLYTGQGEVLDILARAAEGKDYTSPKAVYSLTISEDAAGKILAALEMENADALPDHLKGKVREKVFQALPAQVNAMAGADTLAAASICTAGKVFVDPAVTDGVIYLYTYENGVPVAVTFLPGEDGAVSAGGTFLLGDSFSVDSLEDLSGPLGLFGVEIAEVTP